AGRAEYTGAARRPTAPGARRVGRSRTSRLRPVTFRVRPRPYSIRRNVPGVVQEGRLEMAFEQLKERQSFVWGNAPFEEVADTIADVHRVVIDALGPAQGKQWLDVACGTGDLAEVAAAEGADVTGIDFAAPLIETAKRRAGEHGLDIDYSV